MPSPPVRRHPVPTVAHESTKAVGRAVGESAIQRVLRLRYSPQMASFSDRTRDHFTRIANPGILHTQFREVLDREGVPYRICRWVAWGEWFQDRAVRLGLALLLRREADLRNPGRSVDGWTWAKDHVLAAAERIFWASPTCAALVSERVLSPRGETPDKATFVTGWSRAWPALCEALRHVDADALRAEAERVTATRLRTRRRRAKRVKLSPADAAVVDSIRTILRSALRGNLTGDMTLGELLEREVVVKGKTHNGAPPSAPAKDMNGKAARRGKQRSAR
jgi:hypothetical protein